MTNRTNPHEVIVSEKLLSVPKYLNTSHWAHKQPIQIIPRIWCVFSRRANQSLICILALSYTVSTTKKQFTCVFNQSFGPMTSAVSRLVGSLTCVNKDPCIIWYAPNRSVFQFYGKIVKCSCFPNHTPLLPSSFQGKCFNFVNYHWIILGLIVDFLSNVKESNLHFFFKPLQITMEILSPISICFTPKQGWEIWVSCARLKMTLRTEHAE